MPFGTARSTLSRGPRRPRRGIAGDDPDGLGDVGGRERSVGLATDGKGAQLAFDAALVAARTTGRDGLIEDFGQDRLMQLGPVHRGE